MSDTDDSMVGGPVLPPPTPNVWEELGKVEWERFGWEHFRRVSILGDDTHGYLVTVVSGARPVDKAHYPPGPFPQSPPDSVPTVFVSLTRDEIKDMLL